jgi:ATP-dependent exoDNAse (exonuclease V) alpha subunit
MAIYSLHLGFISRSEGRSSVGFSAYISGGKQQDERTGVVYNFGCKEDVIVSRILAPSDAPEWAKNSSTLWNMVEQFEDQWATLRFRANYRDPDKNQKSLEVREQFMNSSQSAQTIMGAIPIEFSQMEAEACVEEFLNERFVPRGLVVEYAIHWDKGNPHFHGMITRRALVEGGLAQRKDREIVTKPELLVTRKLWETVVNKHLELGGYEVRIDSRSYADQGLDLVPTHHEGWYAQRLAERGEYSRIVADNETIRQKNIEILCKNPAVLVQEVALKRTVFTQKHLEEEIMRRVGGDDKLFSLLKAKVEGYELPSEMVLKTASENTVFEGMTGLRGLASTFASQLIDDRAVVHEVGENLNRDRVFASTAYKKQEETLIERGDALQGRQSKDVSSDLIVQAIKNREAELGSALSGEQQAAISHLCSGPDIRILNGKAGTGKTTLLKAVAEAYEGAGFQVLGTSFQGKAVEIMEQEIGIPCKTLDSFRVAWENYDKQKQVLSKGWLWSKARAYAMCRLNSLEPHQFTSKNVIIVDEANMIGGRLWDVFLKQATDKGAKVLIVQDPAQIKSREPGDYGRLFAERFGACETNEVVRQRIPWQRECSKLLNEYQVLDGLQPYYEKGHLEWFEENTQAYPALAQAYVDHLMAHPEKTRMALAYQNVEVYQLNQIIRTVLVEQGHLQESYKIGGEDYAIGDRIRFLENDNHGRYVTNVSSHQQSGVKGIKNGSFGTITSYDEAQSILTVSLDPNAFGQNRIVQFNPEEYPHFTHGYAMGIHKSEGSTFDRSFVSLSPFVDPSTLLVAMTRHRDNVTTYLNRDQFLDFKDLVEKIGRPALKETLQDYRLSEEQKPAFHRVQQYRDLTIEAVTLREEMESSLDPSTPLHKHGSYPAYQTFFEEKKRVAETILKDWQNHVPYVRLAGIRKDVLEVEAGLRPRLLSDLEHRAEIQVQGYMDLVNETRTLWNTISQTHPGALGKSHVLYEDYQKHKVERDSIASVIQENSKLYTPFLRVTKNEEGEMFTYWGECVTKETRVYISAVKSHAEAHHRSQRQSLYYEGLTSEQKGHYDVVQAYVQTRNETAALYSHLQKQKENTLQVTSPESVLSMKTFHELQTKRDTLALQIIESSEQHQVFFEILKIKEDKLLEHATAAEFRGLIFHYTSATTLEERLERSDALYKVVGESSSINKAAFGILKSMGIELSQLKFDQGCLEVLKEGGELPYKTLSELSSAFVSLHEYRKVHQEAAKNWTIIQTQATQKVTSLQNEQIESLNRLRNTSELTWDLLEEQAALALHMNTTAQAQMKQVVNTQTLSFISRELARAVNESSPGVEVASSHPQLDSQSHPSSLEHRSQPRLSTDLLQEINHRHKELMHFQSHLRKGRSGYLGLYKMDHSRVDHPEDTIWENLRKQKLSLASDALEKGGQIIKVAFQNDHGRMEKEAYEYQVGQRVAQYQNATGEDKAALAAELSSQLKQEGSHGATKTQLKARDVNFEALHLYTLFHETSFDSLEKEAELFKAASPEALSPKEEALHKLETYVSAQETFSALWKPRCEVIERGLAEIKESFNLKREELVSHLEGFKPSGSNPGLNPKGESSPRSRAFVVNDLLEETKVKVETLKVEALKRDTQHQEPLDGQTLLEHHLQEKIQGHEASFGWDLSQHDRQLISQHIRTLSTLQAQIREEQLSLMKDTKFDNDLEFFSSAKKRNEAAYHLMESPFGHAIEESPKDLAVEGYADRYRAKLKEDEIPNDEIAHDGAKQGISRPSPKLPEKAHSNTHRNPSSFISKDDVLDAAKGKYDSLATDLLGTPNRRSSKHELRWGENGSIRFHIAGPKEGRWDDFETGESGNIFELVRREKNVKDFGAAVSYVANALHLKASSHGIAISQKQREKQDQRRAQLKEKQALEEAKDIASRLNGVSELQMKSKSIEGTTAETYLRDVRGIQGQLAPDLRFLSKGTTFMYGGERKTIQHDCFAAFGRDQDGRLKSVQLTKLTPDGKRALDFKGDKLNKIQYGVSGGSFVILQTGEHTGRVFIAEGLETALSIKEANVTGKIIASLGIHNISNYQGLEKEIILCADNDEHKPNSKTHTVIEKAQEHFTAQGHSVVLIKPSHPGDDFNDVLKKQGVQGVETYVKPYLNPHREAPPLSSSTPSRSHISAEASSFEQTNRGASEMKFPAPTKPNNIEIISKYLASKIREMKAFEGSSIGDKARQEVKAYMENFDKTTLQSIKAHDQNLAKELQHFEQAREMSRGRGVDM